ncbi:MAG: tol-pal system protein YbgF [Chromatiales bacterium]|jgi:tol-pal system protein YbgF|nr:tol-pal system protein YbgF [Chromatiales bacterium]MDX9766482.1 tol-pal system protein YbgF [Ectothiorhodospiraceae bacterium]
MQRRPAAFLLVLAIAAAGAAQAQTAGSTDERLMLIEQRLDRMERTLDNKALIEMLQRLEDLHEEVRLLRGDAESNRHDLRNLVSRQRDMYLDLDRRLQQLEVEGVPATAVETPPPVAQPAAPSQPQPIAAVTAPPAAQPVVTQEERDAYRRAFGLLTDGQYDGAATAFEKFLKDYPQSRYAANAQYWLGEAYYVRRDYRTALTEFRKVMDQFADSTKAPDALLKLGFTHYELQEWDQARRTLNDVRTRFPNSSVARLADQRLKRMSEEGR